MEQMLCAPLIETTGRVTPRIEDATVKSTTEERNTRKEIDDENGAAVNIFLLFIFIIVFHWHCDFKICRHLLIVAAIS